MEGNGSKRVWLHGYCQHDIDYLLAQQLAEGNIILGSSVFKPNLTFPLAELTSAMQMAIRGELDEFIVSDNDLLYSSTQVQTIAEIFKGYGVVVKSASSNGNNNS